VKSKFRSAVLIGVPLIVFLLAWAGALYYIYLPVFLPDYLEHNRILDNGSRMTGTVTEVYPFQSSDTEFYASITYTFAPREGLFLTNRYNISLRAIPEIGEPLEIAYDPENPAKNFPVKYTSSAAGYFILWILGASAFGFIAAGLSLLIIKRVTRWDF